jgi:hypothetical protein
MHARRKRNKHADYDSLGERRRSRSNSRSPSPSSRTRYSPVSVVQVDSSMQNLPGQGDQQQHQQLYEDPYADKQKGGPVVGVRAVQPEPVEIVEVDVGVSQVSQVASVSPPGYDSVQQQQRQEQQQQQQHDHQKEKQ